MKTVNQSKEHGRILCVDDAENMLHMFKRILRKDFDVFTAISGAEAIKTLQEHGPFSVIISDYKMPGMSGLALLQEVKAQSPDTVQILLTGSGNLEVAIQAVNEVNVYRYLPKPCPAELLQKTVTDADAQHQLIQNERRLSIELEQKNQQLAHELEMATIVFNNVMNNGHSSLPGLTSHLMSKDAVGGDLLLTHYNHDKSALYLMLGDLTGHGLPAALAAILVSDTFAAQSLNNIALPDLVHHLNEKMCRTLPKGLFCAAIVVRIDLDAQQLEIWQGGLPDAYLLDQDGQITETVRSKNLALGILADPSIIQKVFTFPLASFNTLFACTDGVTEQLNSDMQMYGSERLAKFLKETRSNEKRINLLVNDLQSYREPEPQSDDLALFELNIEQFIREARPEAMLKTAMQ